MRLLFERGFAPTHAFAAFYLWLRNTFEPTRSCISACTARWSSCPASSRASVRATGPTGSSATCRTSISMRQQPVRGHSREAPFGRRDGHPHHPAAGATGLYKGLQDLKDSLTRWRAMDPADATRGELAALIAEQAAAVDMPRPNRRPCGCGCWRPKNALIPDGLHVMGRRFQRRQRARLPVPDRRAR